MDNGYGFGTVLLGIIAGTVLGSWDGRKRGAKKAGQRWHDAILQCAKTGLPTGSDLSEDERVALFAMLKRNAEERGLDFDEESIAEVLRHSANDLVAKAAIVKCTTGESQLSALFRTLGGREKGVPAA